MKVGVLGSGDVGRRLGAGFAAKGHEVLLGTRSPSKPEIAAWLKESKGHVAVGSFADAAAFGSVVVLACVGSVAESVIRLAGESHFDGKVVIDVTNPLDFSKGMPPGLFVGLTDSLGERVQRWLPKARVVKCFNIVGNPTMTHPRMEEGLPTMIIAGNDGPAKAEVTAILREFGWEAPIDIGGIDGARWLEAFVPLWVRIAQAANTWTPAIKVLRK
jgi:predicted dinucleotide-binding enzyme